MAVDTKKTKRSAKIVVGRIAWGRLEIWNYLIGGSAGFRVWGCGNGRIAVT